MSYRAIVLAGGRGRRLEPYTVVFPKPLMPIGDMPILEVVIRQLAAHGVRDITLAVGYLSELIQAFFGDGERFDVRIAYSREQEPLGTAGPIALIDPPAETFLVMNGDLLTTIDFSDFIQYHTRAKNAATIAVFKKKVSIDLGVLKVTDEDEVAEYIEKPELEYAVSTGMYVFEPRVLDHIPAGRFDLPDLIRALLAAGERVGAYRFEGEWLDIGRPDDYAAATTRFEARRGEFLRRESGSASR